jgi:hypothetical protein
MTGWPASTPCCRPLSRTRLARVRVAGVVQDFGDHRRDRGTLAGAQQLAQPRGSRSPRCSACSSFARWRSRCAEVGVLGAQPIDAGQVFAAQGQRVARHQQGALQRVQHGADALAQRGEHTQARVDDQQRRSPAAAKKARRAWAEGPWLKNGGGLRSIVRSLATGALAGMPSRAVRRMLLAREDGAELVHPSSAMPQPRTTQVSGSSATSTGRPVSSISRRSRSRSSAPPPVSMMPRSVMSAPSSGGVCSRRSSRPTRSGSADR